MRSLRALLLLLVVVGAGAIAAAVPARAAATGAVAGTVTGDGGAGVAGVVVRVYGNRNVLATAVTDENGSYLVPGVPAGKNVTVCVDPSGVPDAPVEGYLGNCGDRAPWGGPDQLPTRGYFSLDPGETAQKDTTLGHAGGVTGQVSDPDGTPLGGVVVRVGAFGFTGHTVTASDGTYHLRGVVPDRNTTVCFDGTAATGNPAAHGYLGQCWNDVAWDETDTVPASGANRVVVRADTAVTGIEADLLAAGLITGTVRAQAGGAPVRGARVTLQSISTGTYEDATTGAGGGYRFTGLHTADDYVLCVNAGYIPGRENDLQSECWHDRAWDVRHDHGDTPASDPITVAPGESARYDVALAPTAHIVGTVTTAAAAPLAGITVQVFQGSEQYAEATTDAAGHYDVSGLFPSTVGYTVCFFPTNLDRAPRPGGYRNECHDNQYTIDPYQPPPTTTPVPVVAGDTATVDAQLAPGTEFTGVVTGAAGTTPGKVTVMLFDGSDHLVQSTVVTTGGGRYDFFGLAPRGSYRVCVSGVSTGVSPGFASQCNGGVAWSGAMVEPTGNALPAVAGRSTRVDFTVTPGGVISGLTGSRGDTFEIFVFDAAGHRVGTGLRGRVSASYPRYQVVGLNPATGPYRVCFGSADTGSRGAFGFVPTCWNGPGVSGVTWDGADADVPDVAAVSVTSGGFVSGIDGGRLAPGGVLAGTVRAGSGPSVGTGVSVFAPTGAVVRTTTTSTSGTYRAEGLNPATGPYRVCFDAPAGFRARCWKTASWSGSGGPPAGAVVVGVTGGAVTPGIDVTLPPV